MKKSIFSSLLIFLSPFIYSQPTFNYNDVAVVINSNSQVSIDIGIYFQQARNIPNQNMIYISSVTNELIDTNQFNLVKQQIQNHLVSNNIVDSINYIVLTKGIPHRIERGYCDSISTGLNCSAVDAELTKLLNPPGFSNPYYDSWSNFSRAAFGMYLVTRLDGYTVADVLDLIDNSGPNIIVNKPSSKFIFDISFATDPGILNLFYNFMKPAIDSLTYKSWTVILDSNYAYLSNQQDVIGYYSTVNHMNAPGSLNYSWRQGAVAELLSIYTARTFTLNNPGPNNVITVADLVAEGATGVHGYANLAYAGQHLSTGILFNAYTDTVNDFNLAESYYMSIVHLMQDIIIGDPKTSIIIDNTTSVDDLFSDNEFEIYPNPTYGNFSILFTIISNEQIEFNIYNTLGQIVKIIKKDNLPAGKNQINISTSDLANGIYYLTLKKDDKKLVRKFVKH